MGWRRVLSVAAGLFAAAPLTAHATAHCEWTGYLGNDYAVCTFDPAKDNIRLFNADATGKAYGGFRALGRDIWFSGKHVIRFAMNAGMYHYDLGPVGLHVEEGVEKHALVRGGGWGNFFLRPNGVFYIGKDGKAGVLETEAYAASGIQPRLATQSGPMLVIDGQIHPAFLPQSDSLKLRNGVGVDDKGRVVFVVTKGPVRFYDFAVFYRDVLNCRNALFLDGSISSMMVPEWGRRDESEPLGPILAVTDSLP
ncbi:phosphodiester glycosidase family protein [Rhizobium sp. C4]|uniref:phosphodiester glycosidase family protein n=1 Tax=Rhizobium sp. C4 TaxID=1349800 RepID=UPI001E293343|nr:phosphodiester glycosidase family protein [Rhizobium sp. C4]MCD2175199.1 phosphodiester glycosidase family protein [Rhizobium sp. C4]